MAIYNHSRKPRLLLIVIVYYIVTSVGALVFGLVQPELGIPEVVIQLTQFGPMLGVLVVLPMIRPGGRHSPFSLNLRLRPLEPRRLLTALLLVAGTFVLAWLWYALSGHHIDYTSPLTLSHPFWLIVVAQLIGAAGEEIGWRCFLQPTLARRLGTLGASIVVGLLWGVWHIGVFAEGWRYAAFFILFAVSISVAIGELLRDARGGQLLIAAAYHAFTNVGLLLWFNEEDGSVLAMGTGAVASVIASLAALWIGRLKFAGNRAIGRTIDRSK